MKRTRIECRLSERDINMKKIVNKTLFKKLISQQGKFAVEQVVIGSQVSMTVIKEVINGKLPSKRVQVSLANFLNIDIDELFPVADQAKEMTKVA